MGAFLSAIILYSDIFDIFDFNIANLVLWARIALLPYDGSQLQKTVRCLPRFRNGVETVYLN